MKIHIWMAPKQDRPNIMFRAMLIRIPKSLLGFIPIYDNVRILQNVNIGSTNNKMILPIDKDLGRHPREGTRQSVCCEPQ